jgi:transcriptional regulator with XRE-family HTH domain
MRTALGASLRDARVRARLSLQQLAGSSGGRFRPSSLGGYERGERAISLERFCELSRLLGVAADQLLGDALARAGPYVHREVMLDLSGLPDSDAGRQTAAHVHLVRSRRSDFLSNVVTLRAGDLQVIADASGLDVPGLLSSLGAAVRRVGPT